MKSKPADLANLNIDEPNTVESSMDIMIQGYIDALNGFEEDSVDRLSDQLEQFLLHVAKTGDTLVSWDKVKKVFVRKMKLVLDEFYETSTYKAGKINSNCENDPFEEMKERLIHLTDDFERPPFTMQRLCELVTNPQKNYTKCEKFMRAIEKNLLVVSSWNYSSRRSSDIPDQMNGSFDSRTSYNPVERPWSTLPHSPISGSAPTFPVAAKPDEAATTTSNSLESETTGAKEVDTAHCENQHIDVSNIETESPVDQKTEAADEHLSENAEAVTKEAEPNNDKENDENAAKEICFPGETNSADDSSIKTQADIPSTSLADPLHDETEPTEDMITNVERDEKKEPLPGVGTLVEKHTVITCTLAESLSTSSEPSVSKADNDLPSTSETSSSEAAIDVDVTVTQARSPKRKISEDDVAMEIESPLKRSKSTEDAIDVALTENENP